MPALKLRAGTLKKNRESFPPSINFLILWRMFANFLNGPRTLHFLILRVLCLPLKNSTIPKTINFFYLVLDFINAVKKITIAKKMIF